MITIEEHREKFEAKVLEMQGKNSRMLTEDHQTVRRLKMLENMGEERQLADYNLMRRFGLLMVQGNEEIIEKLVKPGTQLSFLKIPNSISIY